jgi:hypothetical protein
MRSCLAAASAAGTASALTSDLRQALMRLRRGPDWKKKSESLAPNYFVSSDAGMAVCNDVVKILEECADVYRRQFRPRPRKTRPRVRVFSGFESYADYVSDLGADPSRTLGVYLPPLRELCVFLHEDRPTLSNTIRHEGFHQYLHDFLEDAPIWFNEGHAEYFGFSRRKQGRALVGQADDEQVALLLELAPKFSPLSKLFTMEPAEFMASADVHYVESWAVIHMLRAAGGPPTKGLLDPSLTGLLDRYFDALLAGRSQDEAWREVLAPNVDLIEKSLRTYVTFLALR